MAEINKTAPTLGAAVGYFSILYFVTTGDLPEKYHVEAAVMAGGLFTHVFWELGAFRSWIVKMVEKKVNKEE